MRCCQQTCLDTASNAHACGPACTDCGLNSECVSGTCGCMDPFDSCDEEPGCEADLSSDSTNCGMCTMGCGPGTSCIARQCVACTTPLDCPADALPCTDVPVCNGGECSQPLFPGFCLIQGACYGDGDVNPANRCLVCNSGMSATTWTIRAGASCDDNLFCTATDTCNAQGQCVGSGSPCTPDALACTADACNEAADRCEAPIQANACVIQGTCYSDGQLNPATPCQRCSASTSQTAWTPNPGVSCNDGLFCTAVDQCTAQGTCGGSGSPCMVVTTCSSQTCDEGSDTCLDVLNPGWCLIGGSCVNQGMSPLSNPCVTCQPLIDRFGYSPVLDSAVACGGNQMCCGGVCTAVLDGACGACGVTCPPGTCMCGGTGDPFSCACD